MDALRAELYTALAEALADPPDWLALPGSQWPLVSIARELGIRSSDACQAVEKMERIPAEPLEIRRDRYDAMFSGPGRPRFWLYESLYRSGSLFGPETVAVEAIYRAAGLVPDGAELPDHASLELAFLAFAANQQAVSERQRREWQDIERNFFKSHAGFWLPSLGRDLAGSQDAVYAPLGQLLAGWLGEIERPNPRPASRSSSLWSPALPQAEDCSLCGFCVQVCPQRTLTIHENAVETVLIRAGNPCTGCGKCVRICPAHALRLDKIDAGLGTAVENGVLRYSPRAHCPRCGQPTVSQAEIESIAEKIGRAPWIELCQACRLVSLEEIK